MKVFAVHIGLTDATIEDLDCLIPFLETERQKRISNFVRFEDKYRSAVTGLLQYYMLPEHLKNTLDFFGYQYNKYGKPEVSDEFNFEFNLSHSGEWVVGVCSEKKVGIDIEKINYNRKILQSVLSLKEQQTLELLSKPERISTFFNLWVLKEAHVKAMGKGLYIPLNEVSFEINLNNQIIGRNNDIGSWYYKLYAIDSDYKMAICVAEEGVFPEKVSVLSVKDLIMEFHVKDKDQLHNSQY